MDIELLKKIVSEIQQIHPRLVTLHLSGEPLLHNQISKFVQIIKEHGLDVTFSTNGMLLTKDLANELIDAGLDAMRIDFAADPKTYESIRQKSVWQDVYTNIQNLLKAKQTKNVTKPVISLVNIDVTDNPTETTARLKNLVDLFPGHQFESSNLELHSWAGDFSRKVDLKTGKKPDQQVISTPSPCIHLYGSFTITWDGLVVPCCRDLLRDYVIGDLTKHSIREIWNAKKLRRLRRLHAKGRYQEEPLCADCDQVWRNYSLKTMVFKTLGRIKFLLQP